MGSEQSSLWISVKLLHWFDCVASPMIISCWSSIINGFRAGCTSWNAEFHCWPYPLELLGHRSWCHGFNFTNYLGYFTYHHTLFEDSLITLVHSFGHFDKHSTPFTLKSQLLWSSCKYLWVLIQFDCFPEWRSRGLLLDLLLVHSWRPCLLTHEVESSFVHVMPELQCHLINLLYLDVFS